MKSKLVVIAAIALLSCLTNSYSQDQNIEQLKVKVNNIDTLLCDTLDGFKGPNQLLRGYQWGNNRSVSQAIFANQNSIKLEFFCVPQGDTIFVPDPEELQDNAYLLICDPRFWSGTLYDTTLMHSHSMTFEPTLYITENNPTQYQILAKRPNDPTRPIFGFKQIDNLARIPMDSNNPDSSFLKIDNLALLDQLVFSEPWGSEFLKSVLEKSSKKNPFCQNRKLFLQKSKKKYVYALIINYNTICLEL